MFAIITGVTQIVGSTAFEPHMVIPEDQTERPVSPEAVIPFSAMNLEPVYDRYWVVT